MLKPKLPQTSFFMSGGYLYDRIVLAIASEEVNRAELFIFPGEHKLRDALPCTRSGQASHRTSP